MLITNTPNNELHVYNNSGEEIVKIDESGVVEPKRLNGMQLTCVEENLHLYIPDSATIRGFHSSDEATSAMDAMMGATDYIELAFTGTTISSGTVYLHKTGHLNGMWVYTSVSTFGRVPMILVAGSFVDIDTIADTGNTFAIYFQANIVRMGD